MSHQLSEQELQRRSSLQALRKLGIEPYPAAEYQASHYAQDIHKRYAQTPDAEEWKEVSLSGRLMTKRIMGKASFADLMDSTARIQLYFNRDEICPGEDKTFYNDVFKKHLDIGDIIGVKGFIFTTRMGETTLQVKSLTVLSKSLRPLPVVKRDDEGHVYDAFTDPEQRYRMRYVDLLVNDQVKRTFEIRSQLFQAMRSFFNERSYLEVETPILQPIPGGAAARPFVTHHNALDMPLYLRIANELYLKRLIVGGYEGVYEFAKDFRNEGMDRTHNPEFTVLEIYVAYKDYFWMMDFTEKLLEHVARHITGGKPSFQVGGHTIDFTAPYRRISMREAILEHTGYDIDGQTEEQIRTKALELDLEVDQTMGKGKLIDEIFGEKCEPHYIQPTFITDYPVEMSPLCKRHRENPDYTERFELMVNGKEIANAYSELNDPLDQRARFEEQLHLSEKGDDEAMFIDQDFLRALEYGMPPTSGMGIGMDRLAMLFTGQSSIQEVLFFPQMRPEKQPEAPTPAQFEAAGVPAAWSAVALEVYGDVETFQAQKPTQIHQKLNGYRKKKKLDIPALQLDEVEAWLAS